MRQSNLKFDACERIFMECGQQNLDDLPRDQNKSTCLIISSQSKLFNLYLYLFLLGLKTLMIHASPITILSYNTANLNFANTAKLPPLYWSSKNILFSSSMSNHLNINARIGDNIDLVCPKYDTQDESIEYSSIYRVGSKYEFDNCLVDLNNPETVPLLKCDKPFNGPIKYTLYFIKYSPVPYALEFQENKDYYFVSTSTGHKNGLNSKLGGLCSSNNMKFSIRIQPPQQYKQEVQDDEGEQNMSEQVVDTNEYEQVDEASDKKFLSLIFTNALNRKLKMANATRLSDQPSIMNANYMISNAHSSRISLLIMILLVSYVFF